MNHLPYASSHALGWGVYTRLPELPEGWAWIQHANDWLTVREPAGQFYFVSFPACGSLLLIRKRTASLWDWIRTAGRLTPGEHYADYRFTYLFPKTSTTPER